MKHAQGRYLLYIVCNKIFYYIFQYMKINMIIYKVQIIHIGICMKFYYVKYIDNKRFKNLYMLLKYA